MSNSGLNECASTAYCDWYQWINFLNGELIAQRVKERKTTEMAEKCMSYLRRRCCTSILYQLNGNLCTDWTDQIEHLTIASCFLVRQKGSGQDCKWVWTVHIVLARTEMPRSQKQEETVPSHFWWHFFGPIFLTFCFLSWDYSLLGNKCDQTMALYFNVFKSIKSRKLSNNSISKSFSNRLSKWSLLSKKWFHSSISQFPFGKSCNILNDYEITFRSFSINNHTEV